MPHTITDECTGCGTCIKECPAEAINEGEVYTIDAELCTDCGLCAQVCPSGAAVPADE